MNRLNDATRRLSKLGAGNLLAMLVAFTPLAAQAQTDAPATTPPATPPPATPPPPPTQSEAMPATKPDTLPPISVGAWLRAGVRFQGTDPKKLDDQSMDTIYGELHAGGKIHKNVSVTLNLNANGLAAGAGIMDAIIGFDFADPLHLWVGQLLVPADRANGAGPFFMTPWNYPGFFTVGGTTVAALPYEGPYGRNAGAVVWGEFMEGTFKYLLGAFNSVQLPSGAFNAATPATTPLYSGRLNLAIIGKEPGFWGNASYFGEKDVLAVGVHGQYQRNGSAAPMAAPADYSEASADVLAEFKVGNGGWVTGEAAFYAYKGDNNPVKNSFFVLGAFASPTVGYGNIQPMVRYQGAKMETGGVSTNISAVDVGVSYLVKGPALRAMATFQHVDLGNDVIGNSLQLGAQAIFF